MGVFVILKISPNPSLPKRGIRKGSLPKRGTKRRVCKRIPSCDFRNEKKGVTSNKTRFYKHKGNYTWQGIKTERYKDKGSHWADVIRRVLVGNHNESAKFHLRYFEILPGGYTSFEKHKHEHVVVAIRGRGIVFCGESESDHTGKNYTLNFLDTLYIAPDTPHQLSNPFREPFGFLCIVNAKRDKPKILKQKGSRGRGVKGSKESPHLINPENAVIDSETSSE
jgi:ribulose-bisphosphate carboxylase large chain